MLPAANPVVNNFPFLVNKRTTCNLEVEEREREREMLTDFTDLKN